MSQVGPHRSSDENGVDPIVEFMIVNQSSVPNLHIHQIETSGGVQTLKPSRVVQRVVH